MTFINRWLRVAMGLIWLVDRRAAAGALLPGVGGFLAQFKSAASDLGILTIVPFFWGMLALRAWHYR
jgi:hypothetical protein